MSLSRIALRSIRNLADTELSPGQFLNVIYGANGSGKTSVLEAIHVLARAKSFRCGRLAQVARRGTAGFTVAAQVRSLDETIVPLRVDYDNRGLAITVNRQPHQRSAELTAHLPLTLINSDSHQLFEGGPGERRRFVDWGVFHVEHSYLPIWKRYHRALRQRNAALRHANPAGFSAWDMELVQNGVEIDRLRRAYIARLIPWFVHLTGELLDMTAPDITYASGWPEDRTFGDLLATEAHLDREARMTRHGPHRADVLLRSGGVHVEHAVSRGQQKLLACALLLSQAAVTAQHGRTGGVILIDDLPAELDPAHRNRLLRAVLGMRQQTFVTATEKDFFQPELLSGQRVFHVEHGHVTVEDAGPGVTHR